MAGQNQFYPVATGNGANVLTPASWATSNVRQTGFQSGIAPSNAFNTAWRQASEIMYVVAQFIADNGYDALDNGDVATLLANYKSALANSALSGLATTALLHAGVDTSTTANTITIPNVTPNITALANYQVYEIVPNVSVTGATTVAIANLSAVPLYRRNGSQLVNGDAPAGQPFLAVFYNGAMRRLDFAASDVASSTTSAIATKVIVGNRVQVYNAPGTNSFALPADATTFACDLWGAGGGGGGATGNGTAAAASGGGAGDYEGGAFLCMAGSQITIVVGSGGGGGGPAGTNGASGGLSSLTYTKPDGTSAMVVAGGGAGATGSTSGASNNPGAGGTGSGGGDSRPGLQGGFPYQIYNGQFIGGSGGSAYTGSVTPPNVGFTGNNGIFPGGGGSGSSGNNQSGNGSSGGGGANGKAIIRF